MSDPTLHDVNEKIWGIIRQMGDINKTVSKICKDDSFVLFLSDKYGLLTTIANTYDALLNEQNSQEKLRP